MKAELGIIGSPGLLEQIIMFIISQYCSLRPDLVISAQIASHGKRVPFNDFFGWNYKLQIHMLSHVQGQVFFHQTLTTVVSLSSSFSSLWHLPWPAPKLPHKTFHQKTFPKTFSLFPIRKYVSCSTLAWPFFKNFHEKRRSLFCVLRCFSFEVNTV